MKKIEDIYQNIHIVNLKIFSAFQFISFLEWVRITFGIERNSSVRNASEHDFSCFAFNNIL